MLQFKERSYRFSADIAYGRPSMHTLKVHFYIALRHEHKFREPVLLSLSLRIDLQVRSLAYPSIQGGPKSETLLVFDFPHLLSHLAALYLQFLFAHASTALNDVIFKWRCGLVTGNVICRIKEVDRRRARLILGWVTVCRRAYHLVMGLRKWRPTPLYGFYGSERTLHYFTSSSLRSSSSDVGKLCFYHVNIMSLQRLY